MRKFFLFQYVITRCCMLVSLFFFFLTLSFSCTSVEPKSQWQDLNYTQDLRCNPIEYGNDILAVKDVMVKDDKMVLSSMDRTGRDSYFITDVFKKRLGSKLKPLDIVGKVSNFFKYKDKLYLSLYLGSILKITDLDNKSIFEYKLFDSKFKRISFLDSFAVNNILWVVFSLEDNSSYDIGDIKIIGLDLEGFKVVVEHSYSNSDSFSKKFVVNPSKNSLIMVDWCKDEKKDLIIVKEFLKEKDQIITYKLDTADINIESFSPRFYKDYLYISMIEGDSLIGDAKFSIYKYDLNTKSLNKDTGANDSIKPVIKASKDIELAHVSEPVWNESLSNLEVVVFKWLDNESTIGSFSFNEDKNEILNVDLGIFPNSSRIEKTYSIEGNEFLVIKTQDKYFDRYSICKLR